jgi:hypothetical protein
LSEPTLANLTAMTPEEQKRNNLKLGLILGSVALVFFLGFMAKFVFLGK